MTRAEYTPATLQRIRALAQTTNDVDIAAQLGWTRAEVQRRCRDHGIELLIASDDATPAPKVATPPAPEAKPRRRPEQMADLVCRLPPATADRLEAYALGRRRRHGATLAGEFVTKAVANGDLERLLHVPVSGSRHVRVVMRLPRHVANAVCDRAGRKGIPISSLLNAIILDGLRKCDAALGLQREAAE